MNTTTKMKRMRLAVKQAACTHAKCIGLADGTRVCVACEAVLAVGR